MLLAPAQPSLDAWFEIDPGCGDRMDAIDVDDEQHIEPNGGTSKNNE